MMDKQIFYFNIENRVVDVGLRLAVAMEVPDQLGIRMDNEAENKVKVYLEGNEDAARKFYEKLKTKKLGKAEHYSFSELKPIESAGCFSIDTDRFYHKLQCEQLGKFVETGLDMKKSIDGLGDKIDGLGDKIDGLGNKMDALPRNIALELRKVLKE
jgi:hypothetical protein